MATNEYFNSFNQKNEQNLVEDLLVEAIQIFGHDVYYVPRLIVREDKIFGEDSASEFVSAYVIEAYIKTVQGFEGSGDILGKLGLQIQDQLTLTISRNRFKEQTGMIRPREGDLIYVPTLKSLFQIPFVEHESIFYQLGNLNVFDVKIERFNYSQQKIRTGIREIDQIEDVYGYKMNLILNAGSGLFDVGEIAFQGASYGAKFAYGEVVSWNVGTKTLVLKNRVGAFKSTENIKSPSGTSWSITSISDLPVVDNADNTVLETQGNIIIDHTNKSPFNLGKF